jgi:hypothetical protein
MIIREMHEARKASVKNRLANAVRFNASRDPVMSATNIQYEMSEKTRAINVGGIGLVHKLALESGLVDAINSKLHLLKMNFPYVESDHVLNIAYHAICGGVYLEDIELLRNDETYLDALGAESIPDPTTAGDFCRRFDSPFKIAHLQDAINEARLNVWKRQPDSFLAKPSPAWMGMYWKRPVRAREEVAEFQNQPTACKKTYRMIVIRKHIRVEKGQQWLFDKSPYPTVY